MLFHPANIDPNLRFAICKCNVSEHAHLRCQFFNNRLFLRTMVCKYILKVLHYKFSLYYITYLKKIYLKCCFIISSYCKCCDNNKDDIIDSLCHHDHK